MLPAGQQRRGVALNEVLPSVLAPLQILAGLLGASVSRGQTVRSREPCAPQRQRQRGKQRKGEGPRGARGARTKLSHLHSPANEIPPLGRGRHQASFSFLSNSMGGPSK